MPHIEVLFTPAEFERLPSQDLSAVTCIVFDVLRATTSMISALKNGAAAVIPVQDIPEALAARHSEPTVLLAGERDGLRITAELTGSVDFDLGNSPREFVPERVSGRTIVMTTTNGTRALRACAGAHEILVASFLNLGAIASHLREGPPEDLLLVCGGTYEEAAYEDVLGAGALADAVWDLYSQGRVEDSAYLSRRLYRLESADLTAALGASRNGRRLLSRPDLAADVACCADIDSAPLVAKMSRGRVSRL